MTVIVMDLRHHAGALHMSELTIHYPAEVLWALDKTPIEFEAEARLMLALKLYEAGKLSTELAAQLAGLSPLAFVFELGKHGLSPFGETADELAEDMANALRASHRQ